MAVFLPMRPPRPAVDGPTGWEHVRQWDIEAASELEAAAILRSRTGFQRGAVFVDQRGQVPDPNVKCQRIVYEGKPAAVIGGTGRYITTAFFSRGDANTGRQIAEPGGTPVYWVDNADQAAPADHDINGKAIQNSVEEPIDPPLTPLISQEVLNVEWYVQSTNNLAVYQALRPYRNRLNEVAWFGAARGGMLCRAINAMPPDSGYVKCTARFEYRQQQSPAGIAAFYTYAGGNTANTWQSVTAPIEGWASIILLRGRRKRVGAFTLAPDERYQPLVDADGKPITDPVLIDISGVPVTNNQAQALVFYHHEYKDFAGLGI
jgi:hypothetical protein